jgi:hypothetical protein
VAVLLCGCGKQTSPSVFVDPALATLVPSDTTFIAGARVQQITHTPFYERFVASRKLPLIEAFARESGIDPRKDLWEVLIPTDGKTTWVMLRGKFTEMGMEPRVNREGAQRLRYKGYTILGDEQMAVLFLNPTTAIAAPEPALRAIIDNRDKGTGIPRWLQDRIRKIPSTNQFWFAGRQSIGDVTGAIDLRSGVNGEILITADSEGDAQKLKAALLGPSKGSGITAGSEGAKLNVNVAAPPERMEEVVERAIAWVREWRRPD